MSSAPSASGSGGAGRKCKFMLLCGGQIQSGPKFAEAFAPAYKESADNRCLPRATAAIQARFSSDVSRRARVARERTGRNVLERDPLVAPVLEKPDLVHRDVCAGRWSRRRAR